MHCAQGVADTVLAGAVTSSISSRAFTSNEAASFAASLRNDAIDYIYSGVLSVAEATQGLDRGLFSWATVKLYYSVFYFVRASLGMHRVGIVYRGGTPYTWTAVAGQTPTKRSGTTHKVALEAFKLYRSGSTLVSQNIGTEEPFSWLMARREAVNYKVPKFCEPSAPAHFRFVGQHGVRRLVGHYSSDDWHLFAFDPDHAMLAFPIATMKLVLGELNALGGPRLLPDDAAFLASQVLDKNGPLPELRKMLLS